jgi:myosin heavy subunit
MFQHVEELWGTNEGDMEGLLERRVMVTRGERMEIRHTAFQMQACRDAVARGVYVRLWEWVVKELNKAIMGGGGRGRRGRQ